MLYARLRDPFGASKVLTPFTFIGAQTYKIPPCGASPYINTLSFNIREYVHGIAPSFGLKSRGS
jgi:hypothetical protein